MKANQKAEYILISKEKKDAIDHLIDCMPNIIEVANKYVECDKCSEHCLCTVEEQKSWNRGRSDYYELNFETCPLWDDDWGCVREKIENLIQFITSNR